MLDLLRLGLFVKIEVIIEEGSFAGTFRAGAGTFQSQMPTQAGSTRRRHGPNVHWTGLL
jgi:hypothetical protein